MALTTGRSQGPAARYTSANVQGDRDGADDRTVARTGGQVHLGEREHLRVEDRSRADAIWAYPEPLPGAPDLSELVAFHFSKVDEWWEEAERIVKHPRDPYHRVDAIASDRRVVIRLGGQPVAESASPTMLFETGLPPRFHLREQDVAMELLARTGTVTTCSYKGTTSRYYHLEEGGHRVAHAAWVYDEPNPEAAAVRGRLAFLQERLDLEVDGEPWARPDTPFG